MRVSIWPVGIAAAIALSACGPTPIKHLDKDPQSVRVGNCFVSSAVVDGNRVYVASGVYDKPCGVAVVKP